MVWSPRYSHLGLVYLGLRKGNRRREPSRRNQYTTSRQSHHLDRKCELLRAASLDGRAHWYGFRICDTVSLHVCTILHGATCECDERRAAMVEGKWKFGSKAALCADRQRRWYIGTNWNAAEAQEEGERRENRYKRHQRRLHGMGNRLALYLQDHRPLGLW